MAKSAKTAIVILNWNGWADTIECLQSLSQLNNDCFSVIVVDNASTDDSRNQLLSWKDDLNNLNCAGEYSLNEIESASLSLSHLDWIYIQSPVNGGFAYGNNLGIKFSMNLDFDYVWLLNNDTVVEPGSLDALLAQINSQDDIGMCGSVLRFYDNKKIIQAVGGVDFNFIKARGSQLGQGLPYSSNQVADIAKQSPTYIAGASLLVSSAFLHDVGMMEESYFLYFEEIDWAVRASPSWKTAIAVDSVVYHKEGASIGTSSLNKRSPLSQYYLHRNLIRFYALRKLWLLPFALFSSLKELIKLVLNLEWLLLKVTVKGILDGLLMRSGKVL